MGLTVRLQHKLKETQIAKDKLEKKIEHMEMRSGPGGGSHPDPDPGRRNIDSIRLNELEIENGRLKQDLKRLRESIAVSFDFKGGQGFRN